MSKVLKELFIGFFCQDKKNDAKFLVKIGKSIFGFFFNINAESPIVVFRNHEWT